MTDEDVVRAFRLAYEKQDTGAAERLAADDFVFTSPQDDRISRAEWFEKCFPTLDHFRGSTVLAVTGTPAGVLSLYEYQLQSGEWYRNTELSVVRDGRVAEVQVYFGGQVPAPVA
jgi:ketosteroid isomerase-like protein